MDARTKIEQLTQEIEQLRAQRKEAEDKIIETEQKINDLSISLQKSSEKHHGFHISVC